MRGCSRTRCESKQLQEENLQLKKLVADLSLDKAILQELRSKRPRRRKMVVERRERYVPKRPNQAWSMDFVADQLVDGTRFRALTVVDVFTREALSLEVGHRLLVMLWLCAIASLRSAMLRSGCSSTTVASFPEGC
jgi:transposase InsO family protein